MGILFSLLLYYEGHRESLTGFAKAECYDEKVDQR